MLRASTGYSPRGDLLPCLMTRLDAQRVAVVAELANTDWKNVYARRPTEAERFDMMKIHSLTPSQPAPRLGTKTGEISQ